MVEVADYSCSLLLKPYTKTMDEWNVTIVIRRASSNNWHLFVADMLETYTSW